MDGRGWARQREGKEGVHVTGNRRTEWRKKREFGGLREFLEGRRGNGINRPRKMSRRKPHETIAKQIEGFSFLLSRRTFDLAGFSQDGFQIPARQGPEIVHLLYASFGQIVEILQSGHHGRRVVRRKLQISASESRRKHFVVNECFDEGKRGELLRVFLRRSFY